MVIYIGNILDFENIKMNLMNFSKNQEQYFRNQNNVKVAQTMSVKLLIEVKKDGSQVLSVYLRSNRAVTNFKSSHVLPLS